jgi:hypothetical protein
MFTRTLLVVSGGSTRPLTHRRFAALQSAVGDFAPDKAPLFLRMGRNGESRHQPVAVSTLLKELGELTRLLRSYLVPGAEFRGENGNLLGAFWAFGDGLITKAEGGDLRATPDGLAVTVTEFPPPVGFRSESGLPPGAFRCYFERIQVGQDAWHGNRTEEMGGSGQPVRLAPLPLPAATRWDTAFVSGNPSVREIRFVTQPASHVFQDELHALEAAGHEALRLKHPLHVIHE